MGFQVNMKDTRIIEIKGKIGICIFLFFVSDFWLLNGFNLPLENGGWLSNA